MRMWPYWSLNRAVVCGCGHTEAYTEQSYADVSILKPIQSSCMRMWPYWSLYTAVVCGCGHTEAYTEQSYADVALPSPLLYIQLQPYATKLRQNLENSTPGGIWLFFCQCGGSELILVRIQVQHFAFTDMDPTFRIRKVKQIRNGVFSKRDEEFVHFPPYYESLQST